LKKVVVDKKLDYKINEGDGAFYGPKIDFHVTDSLVELGSVLLYN
jgi:threonyl-tRNA synthetase